MKNKNNPNEELKQVKGNVYYSEEENEFYSVEEDNQTPLKDKEKLLNEMKESYEIKMPFIESILKKCGLIKEPEEKPEIKIKEREDFFLWVQNSKTN